MVIRASFLVLLLLPAAALAELSPAERADKGEKIYGVFDINDPVLCSAAAIKRIIGPGIIANETVIGKNAMGGNITGKSYGDMMRDTVRQAMDALKESGDTVVAARHVCVGAANFGEAGPNAVAMKKGYILADPRLTDLVNSMPDRTMFSLEMFFVHELAHHLQYWNGSPFDEDARDRRSELAADCTASALVSMRWTEPFALRSASDGVVAAAVRVGDHEHEDKGHHGTPYERSLAAKEGVRLVLEARTAKAKLPSSKVLLDRCNKFIIDRDKSTGPNWKP